MLLFDRSGTEVENSTFALGQRFILNISVLLKFPMQGGSRTGLVVRDLSKALLCCCFTSSLVLIFASLSFFLGKMENTNFIHASISDLHLLSCRTVNGIPITLLEHWKQSRPTVNSDSCDLALKKCTVWAPHVTSHSWERRERASERKGGGLTESPADSGTHLPPGNSSEMKKHTSHRATFTILVYTFHSWPWKIKHLALRNLLEPQSRGEDKKVNGWQKG